MQLSINEQIIVLKLPRHTNSPTLTPLTQSLICFSVTNMLNMTQDDHAPIINKYDTYFSC